MPTFVSEAHVPKLIRTVWASYTQLRTSKHVLLKIWLLPLHYPDIKAYRSRYMEVQVSQTLKQREALSGRKQYVRFKQRSVLVLPDREAFCNRLKGTVQ